MAGITRACLTRVELARRMGTTQSSIARIEGGGTVPTLEMLARLAWATGIPVHLGAAGVADVKIGADSTSASLPQPHHDNS